MGYLYGFSAAHIQSYILRSSRLRDIQGASQLLEQLCTNSFDQVVTSCGLESKDILSQAAGGARVQSDDVEPLLKLHSIWPLAVHSTAPGIEIDQAIVEVGNGGVAEAHMALSSSLNAARSCRPTELPVVGPMVRRAPRTGYGAVAYDEIGEYIDGETQAKRRAWAELKRDAKARGRSSLLDDKFLGELKEKFRFQGGDDEDSLGDENRYVALIHIDGNSVGRKIQRLLSGSNQGARVFQNFSNAMSEATMAAARKAVSDVLGSAVEDGVLPARPILLGGDDVTILVRADLGVEFARVFLESFEKETGDRKDSLLAEFTASAGIAFVKVSYPYDRAHALAEALCNRAKRMIRNLPEDKAASAIAFHKVTTSLADTGGLLESELTGPSGVIMTMGAYGVGRNARSIASLGDLETLSEALPVDNKGGVRDVIDMLMEDTSLAEFRMGRLKQVQQDRGSNMDALDAAMKALINRENKLVDGMNRTPLLDALLFREFSPAKKNGKSKNDGQGA